MSLRRLSLPNWGGPDRAWHAGEVGYFHTNGLELNLEAGADAEWGTYQAILMFSNSTQTIYRKEIEIQVFDPCIKQMELTSPNEYTATIDDSTTYLKIDLDSKFE